MPRPSFYELYQRVLEEGSFWDMIANHARTGWNLGWSTGPKPYVPGWLARRFASQPPPEVNTDPFGNEHEDLFDSEHDDLFSSSSDDLFGSEREDPFRASDAGEDALPGPYSLPVRKRYKPPQVLHTKKYFPYGAFSTFYVERPIPVRRTGKPGRTNASKVANDAVLRDLRRRYRQEHKPKP